MKGSDGSKPMGSEMSRNTDERRQQRCKSIEPPFDESRLILDIEREVMGSDYGASSYTTCSEAAGIGELLALGPGVHLLDIGSGSGWPGLYLAKSTGCDVTLVDKPLSGLKVAAARASEDRLSGICSVIVGDGRALPFDSERFHAISHSDVLC
jgi:protein-L-isoaspartate O-methyltransferase